MRIFHSRLGLVAAAVTLAGTALSTQVQAAPPGPPASVSLAKASYSTPAGAIFSRPGSGTIENRVIANIENTPPGAYIRGVTWTFTSSEIARALISAHEDGAVVRMLVSRRSREEAPVKAMAEAFKSDCGPGKSCLKVVNFSARGTDKFDGVLTTLHQKSWTFSTTGEDKRVTLITSHNATTGARDWQYNAGYQFVGNDKVYDAMVTKFVDQTADTPLANPWDVATISKTVALSFGPWNSPAMTDPVVKRVRGLPNDGLVVRIANSGWTGDRGANIARAVAAKARNGAKVFVLASRPFGAGVRQILEGAGVPIHEGYFSDTNYHHLKFMTAKWGSGADTKTRVWTGSENWSQDARGADELTVRVGAGSTHSDFVRFFDSIYN